MIVGVLSLVLGVVGIVVPLLPTTPFLLLSAALFMRTSPKLYNWLIHNRVLGEYIINYNKNRAISLRAKSTSISLLWISILYSVIFVIDLLWVRVLLLLIAVGVTWHLLSLKTIRQKTRKKRRKHRL